MANKVENKSAVKNTSNLRSESKAKESSKSENKQVIMPGDPCPCASMIPQCCTPEFDNFMCDCIAKPDCGECPSGSFNAFSNFHDSMLKMAMKDAFNQQDMAHKAKLQVELFQKAQDFAKEVGIQEMKAKQFARVLNDATRKAQVSRAMMFQAASQVRLLADKTLKAISPIRCNGPRCSGAAIANPVVNQIMPMQQDALFSIKQKLNNLSSMTNPTMAIYGGYGNGEYQDMKEQYFRNYRGDSRESSYAPQN